MIQPTSAQQMYPQAGGANAVAINIYNPQAYGAGVQPNAQAPYNYTNSLYQMPNSSMYAQTPQGMYPQYMPTANIPTQTTMPAPQVMPDSVMTQQNAAAPEQQANIAETNPQVQDANAQQAQNGQTVNTDELIQTLKNTDPAAREKALNQIAFYAQQDPQTALQVVTEPIMQTLTDVLKEDTSALQGPSEEQIKIANKDESKRTDEEKALLAQISPRDHANRNKMLTCYTLALLQKLQRDDFNQYIETQKANGEQPLNPLKLEDLIGYNDIVNVLQNEQEPALKLAALQALKYIATPDDKATLEPIIAEALKSENPEIKSRAEELSAQLAAAPVQPTEQTQAQQPAEQPAQVQQPVEQQVQAQQPTVEQAQAEAQQQVQQQPQAA